MCEFGHGRCTAPDTICPHWIGAICELMCALKEDKDDNGKEYKSPPHQRIPFPVSLNEGDDESG